MFSIQAQYETTTAECGRELWGAAQEIEQLRKENAEMREEFARIFTESVALIERAFRQVARLHDENEQLRGDLARTRMQAASRAEKVGK